MNDKTEDTVKDTDCWSTDELHQFWFGDGSRHNRGLVGDVLRWLCYRPTQSTQDLVCSFLHSSKFEQICAAFGYAPENFRAAARRAVARHEAV